MFNVIFLHNIILCLLRFVLRNLIKSFYVSRFPFKWFWLYRITSSCYHRIDSPTMPPQQVEYSDGWRHARHARRPTAAHRFRPTAPAHFYPPGPKRLAQVRPRVFDRTRTPVHQPRAHHLLVLGRKLFRKLQVVRPDDGLRRLGTELARRVSTVRL